MTEIRGDGKSASIQTEDVKWLSDLKRARTYGPSSTDRTMMSGGNSTLSVHAGTGADPLTGAVGTPIYQASTFLLNNDQYRAFDQGYARDRFIYSRYGNPSQWAVQEKLAALEHAESALVLSSGMAAISCALLALSDAGGHIVASSELYGGTYAFFNAELPGLGRSSTLVDPRDLDAIEAAITPDTQVLFFEVLTNPLLKVVDIPAIVEIAKRHGCRTVFDATFATPLGVRPLDHGADIVVHSATKYLNGHSDLVAGVAAGSRKLIDQLWGRMLVFGGCLDPHCCFLLERGLKTLAIRMEAHQRGASVLAGFLQDHPRVRNVYYPALQTHPDWSLANALLENCGGVVTFEIEGGDEASLRLLKALTLPQEATSLGGVESLISLPFNSSHSGFTVEQRRALGIHPGMVRMSTGIEDPEDLIADFEAALSKIYMDEAA